MDDELFRELRGRVRAAAAGMALQPRHQFTDSLIAEVYLWACRQHKPISWACRKGSWPLWARRRPLPTPSTMSRRLWTDPVQSLIRRIERFAAPPPSSDPVLAVDGKPLPVGGATKDRQAKNGWAVRGYAKGYKLHAICDQNARFLAWTVEPMNVAEPTTAALLVARADLPAWASWLIGDSSYDSNPLHAATAARGLQLVAPRKEPDAKLGWQRHHRNRLASIAITEAPDPAPARRLEAKRQVIERAFGHLTTFDAGLSPLPPWVRGPRRVRLWVQAKIIINYCRLRLRAQAAA